ncbi:hypothetical protein DTO207G8_2458 [Paecilomyces variotii]|nr:hypothetical protein DTO032I3_7747 [Paecilomyces variotii]KAJ9256855.1 hypothetical protein DTO207G8_2458 [Paecilomyces variotii]KAJ9279022.1 hypothetical protein DTO021D3_4059 [Paecilomyces variotii]KAJ9344320.1 hypothetical protein DTO027B6_2938 [Paecilomyces variotii]KAJ9388177.1 hypothetical protein DTO032I4_2801 [Paecilomyces variotii]
MRTAVRDRLLQKDVFPSWTWTTGTSSPPLAFEKILRLEMVDHDCWASLACPALMKGRSALRSRSRGLKTGNIESRLWCYYYSLSLDSVLRLSCRPLWASQGFDSTGNARDGPPRLSPWLKLSKLRAGANKKSSWERSLSLSRPASKRALCSHPYLSAALELLSSRSPPRLCPTLPAVPQLVNPDHPATSLLGARGKQFITYPKIFLERVVPSNHKSWLCCLPVSLNEKGRCDRGVFQSAAIDTRQAALEGYSRRLEISSTSLRGILNKETQRVILYSKDDFCA